MAAKKTTKRRMPVILKDRRGGAHKDNIQKRDWSKNPLGQAFVKKPEEMRLSKFYSMAEGGSAQEYRMHKLLEQKIRHLIKARPFAQYGLVFLKGESGAFYVRLLDSSHRAVYLRVDKPRMAAAIKFLFK